MCSSGGTKTLRCCTTRRETTSHRTPLRRCGRSTAQSRRAPLLFIIEQNGELVGECWLQRMNLERVLSRYPGRDLRRIDLMIGEKRLWGQGLGSEAIRLLAAFGLEQEHADGVFGCDIADYNARSLRAFTKAGFRLDESYPEPPGRKASTVHDVVLTREA